MKKFLTIVFLLSAISLPASATFVGFPLSDDETNDWIYLNETYHPVSQIVSGINERCDLTGVETVNVVEVFSYYNGQTAAVVVVGGFTYTNHVDTYTNVTVTNALGPVLYSYADITGGIHSVTGSVPVTRWFWSKLDAKIEELIPYFLSTNAGGDLTQFTLDNQWVETDFGNTTFRMPLAPTETKAGLFSREGIGSVTNITWYDQEHPNASYECLVSNVFIMGG